MKSLLRKTSAGATVPASLLGIILLAGCGAGSQGDATGGVVPADSTAYAATVEYCGAQEPTGSDAQPGSWTLTSPSRYGKLAYDVSALVSPAGADTSTRLPVRLEVENHDYRRVTGSFIPSAYVEPEWKMGVTFYPVLPAKSAACVVSLAKVSATVSGLPGASALPTHTLSWTSQWSANVPVASVPGTVVDGFEFVSTFTPAGAQAFFAVSKTRLPDAAGASICYLAPSATQWNCAPASVTDWGKDWAFSYTNPRPGVYVLAAAPAQ